VLTQRVSRVLLALPAGSRLEQQQPQQQPAAAAPGQGRGVRCREGCTVRAAAADSAAPLRQGGWGRICCTARLEEDLFPGVNSHHLLTSCPPPPPQCPCRNQRPARPEGTPDLPLQVTLFYDTLTVWRDMAGGWQPRAPALRRAARPSSAPPCTLDRAASWLSTLHEPHAGLTTLLPLACRRLAAPAGLSAGHAQGVAERGGGGRAAADSWLGCSLRAGWVGPAGRVGAGCSQLHAAGALGSCMSTCASPAPGSCMTAEAVAT
jgi:hypothetical protein